MTGSAGSTGKLDALFQPWNRSDAPGLVVGVAHRGQTIYRRGFGLSSIEHGTANTPQTKMRIGSTSKHFTSLAVLLLAEDGLVDVDAQVRSYLPELSGPAGDPTLRQLMNHSGGLRDPYELPGILLCGAFPQLLADGADLELSLRFTSANFAPGERMIYCNNGYHLLSLLVERVSGTTLAAFLEQRVFEPLAMNQTALLTSDMAMTPGIASFHLPQADGSYRRGIYPSEELLGSGGMISTIDDMLRWLAHLRSPTVVGTARSWAQMLERPRYSSGASGDYCLGLTREQYRGVEIVHHAGATLGCMCQTLTVPGHELDIVVIYNRMDSNPSAMALKIIDVILESSGLPAAVLPVGAESRTDVTGYWYAAASHRLYGIASHPVEGQTPVLALSVHTQVMGVLKPSESGLRTSSPAHGSVEVVLPPIADDRAEQLEIIDSGHRESCTRLPETGPDVAALAPDIVGSYRYEDLDRELAVIVEDGALYLDLRPLYGKSRLQLEPFSNDVCGFKLTGSFPIPVPTTGSLAIERKDGRVSGLWLNSPRTRNLWLQRC